uniref:Uncharacterized protein n=1 Tax=Rhizophora mucronata TaxID=61149 RepID=A0A2P2MRM2_RHIMU
MSVFRRLPFNYGLIFYFRTSIIYQVRVGPNESDSLQVTM